MTELIAKPVIKNKYWVVEQSGKKIATIQAVEDGGYVYVHNERRERFTSVKVLGKKYNIQFTPVEKKTKTDIKEVYGFPATGRTYNEVYDVKHKVAVFTKLPKSRSHYCAGYYLVKTNNKWSKVFCPKTIVIKRYPYFGPYKTEEQMLEQYNKIGGKNGV